MREQAVAAGKVDAAATSEHASHASSHFPGFVQFLARQATGMTHSARKTIEERVAREPPEIVRGETRTRRMVEHRRDRHKQEARESGRPDSRAFHGGPCDFYFSAGFL